MRSAMDELKDLELTDVVVYTDKEIGRGSYGYVVELKVKGLKCAGKILHDTFFDSVQSSEPSWISSVLARECIQHSKLHHPNIVECFGVHTSEVSKLPILVMELMDMSLRHCLEKYHDIPARLKYGVLHDVSLGVQYLHDHNPPIVHRDLTANNVLLTRDMKAKVADFGVTRVIDPNKRLSTLTKAPGTPIYMPPESLNSPPIYNQQLDIFSFGVLVIHVALQVFPIPECSATKMDRGNLVAISEVNRRASFFEKMDNEPALRILAKKCLSNDPEQRPHINNIVCELDGLLSQHSKMLPFSNVVEASQLLKEGQCKHDTLVANAQSLDGQLHAIVAKVKSMSQWSTEAVSDLTMQLQAASALATSMAEGGPPDKEESENRFVVSYTPQTKVRDLQITIDKNAPMIVRPPINMRFSGTYVKTVVSGLWKAFGVAVGKRSGQVFAVDYNGYESVLMYNPDGNKRVLLRPSPRLQVTPPDLSCWYPYGLAFVESDGVLFVADSGNRRILKLRVPTDASEDTSFLAKSECGVFTSTRAVGIGVTDDRKVIVCDRDNHQLVILESSNLKFVRTFGSQGEGPCQFQHPWYVAFDSRSNIYVSDCSNRCLKVFTPDFKPLRTIGCPGPDVCNLRAPTGICIDSNDYIYVADKGLCKVFVFDPAGNFKMRFGEYGTQNGQFIKPLGITVDIDGVVYVSDGKGGRVQAFK